MDRTGLKVLALLAGAVFLVGHPTKVQAQTAGTITGTVTDPSGDVVPTATVTVTDSGTGVVTRTLNTGTSGIYAAEALPVGTSSARPAR